MSDTEFAAAEPADALASADPDTPEAMEPTEHPESAADSAGGPRTSSDDASEGDDLLVREALEIIRAAGFRPGA